MRTGQRYPELLPVSSSPLTSSSGPDQRIHIEIDTSKLEGGYSTADNLAVLPMNNSAE